MDAQFEEIDEINLDVILAPLHEGCKFLKFGRAGIPHEKFLRLSEDNKFITWSPGWRFLKRKEECRVYLEDVVDIQEGQGTRPFQRHKKWFRETEALSLSLIYGSEGKTFDIIAHSKKNYDDWFHGLTTLLTSLNKEKKYLDIDKQFLKMKWDAADIDNSGRLTKKEVANLVTSIHTDRPTKVIYKFFDEIDIENQGVIDFDEFCRFMDNLRKRPELEVVWFMVLSGMWTDDIQPLNVPYVEIHEDVKNSSMPIAMFADFWSEMQGEQIIIQDVLSMIYEVMPMTQGDIHEISYYVWLKIILNKSNDAFDPNKLILYQDMNQPLSHYYISSSHNTYLESDQLTGYSSTNRYIDDLQKNCRYVEIDVWDGDNGDPIVTHGHSLTSKIYFFDVIIAIKTYAFKNSPYPLIVSIESHCSLDQQKKMADILSGVLGRMLHLPKILSEDDEQFEPLPSPEELKYKIILKGKRESTVEEENDFEETEEDSQPSDRDADSKGSRKQTSKGRSLTAIHPDLSSLLFFADQEHRSVESPPSYLMLRSVATTRVVSTSETKYLRWVKSEHLVQQWVIWNESRLSRIFPKGTRIDASNYDPSAAWGAGNQVVALNFQTKGVAMQLNDSKFRENGNCGYVLKPQYMISRDAAPEPGVILDVHILSGQQLPKLRGGEEGEVIDPYVLLKIFGLPPDEAEFKTSTVHNNGFNPIWDEVVSFQVSNPEVAIISFTVYDHDIGANYFIGYAAVPIACLRPGLRVLSLCSEKGVSQGDYQFASLCVRIGFRPLSNQDES